MEDAGGEEKGLLCPVVFRVLPVGHVVAHARAVVRPILVEGRDRDEVRHVDLLDEVLCLADQVAELRDRAAIHRRRRAGVDRRRHTAHQEALRVWILPAEQRVHLDEFPLPVERLEIVRHRQEIYLRWQRVGRMPPEATSKESELPAIRESLQAALHIGEVRSRRVRPVRDGLRQEGGPARIRLESGEDVDPVQRVQVVEVDHVVLYRLRRDDQVAQQPRVGGRLRADGLLHRAHRADRMDGGADAADPLGEGPGIPRVAVLENQLDSAKHGRGGPRLRDDPIRYLGFDAQVAFDSRDRIDDDASPPSASHQLSLLRLRATPPSPATLESCSLIHRIPWRLCSSGPAARAVVLSISEWLQPG